MSAVSAEAKPWLAVDVWNLRVGDQVRERGRDIVLTVHHIDPECSAGRAQRFGPYIHAHVRPGGYGVGFDAETTSRFERISDGPE